MSGIPLRWRLVLNLIVMEIPPLNARGLERKNGFFFRLIRGIDLRFHSSTIAAPKK